MNTLAAIAYVSFSTVIFAILIAAVPYMAHFNKKNKKSELSNKHDSQD